MKRILSILITAILALSCLMASADAEPLTRNEMNAWRRTAWKTAAIRRRTPARGSTTWLLTGTP